MKKLLYILLAIMIVTCMISAAIAGAVDSKGGEDITDIVIEEIIPATPSPTPTKRPDPPATKPTPSASPSTSPSPTPTATVPGSVPETEPEEPPAEIPEIEFIVSTDIENIPEIEQIIEDIKTEYHVTVSYILPDGTPIADPRGEVVSVGDRVSDEPPEIPGYVPIVLHLDDEMPNRNVEHTVIYLPEEQYKNLKSFFTIDDYDSPLGLGYSAMNVGVCIE